MSYQPDYVHMQNLIMRAVESIANDAPAVGHEGMVKSYGELIDFLETMYVNSILSLVGCMLQAAKISANEQDTSDLLDGARAIVEQAPMVMTDKLADRYNMMIKELNLPDAFSVSSEVTAQPGASEDADQNADESEPEAQSGD